MGIGERWKGYADLPADVRSRIEGLTQLLEQEEVTVAYLFGSLARGEEGRDVDLALLRSVDPVHSLWTPIAQHLGTERLDLVDLSTAPPVLRFDILRNGRLLYAADERVLERFEMETLRLYRDTAPLRERHRHYLKESFAHWS